MVTELKITSQLKVVSLIKLFPNRPKGSQEMITRQINLFSPNTTIDVNNDTPSTTPNIPRFKGNNPNLPIIPKKIKVKTMTSNV